MSPADLARIARPAAPTGRVCSGCGFPQLRREFSARATIGGTDYLDVCRRCKAAINKREHERALNAGRCVDPACRRSHRDDARTCPPPSADDNYPHRIRRVQLSPFRFPRHDDA